MWDTFGGSAGPETEIAELKSIQFWPMWSAGADVLGKSVEPDVVLHLVIGEAREPWTFIIECRLGGSQGLSQLCDEWERASA